MPSIGRTLCVHSTLTSTIMDLGNDNAADLDIDDFDFMIGLSPSPAGENDDNTETVNVNLPEVDFDPMQDVLDSVADDTAPPLDGLQIVPYNSEANTVVEMPACDVVKGKIQQRSSSQTFGPYYFWFVWLCRVHII